MNKKRARTISEKEYRKEQLKRAALQLFAKRGFKSTTVGMITKKAHLSPASFYLYFVNKIAIYRELNKDGIHILEKLIQEGLKSAGGYSVDKLYALAEAYVTFFKEYQEYFYITEILHLGNAEFFYDTRMVKELEDHTLRLLKVVANVIDGGIKKGELQRIDAMKTAVTLWGMIDGVLILEVKKSTGFTGLSVDALITQMMDMIVQGIMKR
ncbi:MAG: TetR/AcrR family transcriptional regulator [Spirochaetes bacterium]|nr:TetR/AcrR family transcriptional regulator [Spirochaetota bacterium]